MHLPMIRVNALLMNRVILSGETLKVTPKLCRAGRKMSSLSCICHNDLEASSTGAPRDRSGICAEMNPKVANSERFNYQ